LGKAQERSGSSSAYRNSVGHSWQRIAQEGPGQEIHPDEKVLACLSCKASLLANILDWQKGRRTFLSSGYERLT
jgi:hypothetical protein